MRSSCVLWFLLLLCWDGSVWGLRWGATKRQCRRMITCKSRRKLVLFDTIRASGYIPPELDPEYRKSDGTSTLRANTLSGNPELIAANVTSSDFNSKLPVPKEGDVVLYKGRFGSKQLGRLRFMQYVATSDSFFLDIVPLKEKSSTVSSAVFVVDRASKAEFLAISQVQPVKSAFLRAEDGYQVYFKPATNDTSQAKGNNFIIDNVVLRAETYRPLEKSFQPKRKPVNFAVLDNDFKDYENLKSRIIVLALQLGVVFAGAFAFFFDGNVSLSYLAGVSAGVVYFLLLAKKVEAIGARYSALPLRQPPISGETPAIGDVVEDTQTASGAEERTNTAGSIGPSPRSFFSLSPAFLGETLANLRFLVPVLLLATLVEKDQVFEHFPLEPFSLLPRNEYIAAMGGFLTLRMALYLSEVAKEFRVQDILGILPGSLAIVARKFLFSEDNRSAAEILQDNQPVLVPHRVLLITGPVAAGRYEVARKLFLSNSNDPKSALSADSSLNSRVDFRLSPLWTSSSSSATTSATTFHQSKSQGEVTTLRQQHLQSATMRNSNSNNGQSAMDTVARKAKDSKDPSGNGEAGERMSGFVAWDGSDRDEYGRRIQTLLPRDSIAPMVFPTRIAYRQWLDNAKKKASKDSARDQVTVLVGPPALHAALATDRSQGLVDLTTVWISLQSKDVFIQKASDLVKAQLQSSPSLPSTDGSSSASLVQYATDETAQLVNEAVQDITYFMQRAPLIDHTVLNNPDDEDSVLEELRNILAKFKTTSV